MTERILFCDNIAGLNGKMFAASCIDAGLVTTHDLRQLAIQLGFTSYLISSKKCSRAGISSTYIDISPKDHSTSQSTQEKNVNANSRPYRHIKKQIHLTDLASSVKEVMFHIYDLLAKTEALVHNTTIENTHFHELGSFDSFLDIAMASYIIDRLSFEKVLATPVKLGRGKIHIQHGIYPVPPPATALLARGLSLERIPDEIDVENIELTTPTGLAILNYLQPEFTDSWPSGRLLHIGYGAGLPDFAHYPNVFRMALLENKI